MRNIKVSKNSVCALILAPFVVCLVSVLFSIVRRDTSLNIFINYRYLVFFLVFSAVVFLHSYYLFRRNIKWGAFSSLVGVLYSTVIFLGFVGVVERVFGIDFGESLRISAFSMLLANTFFSYLFFGLAAKAYYKKKRRTSVSEVITDTFKKNITLFVNILISVILMFFCTAILGGAFFLNITLIMLLTAVVSVLVSMVFCTTFYLFCLENLG